VNDRAQLAAAEAELRCRINERWMRRGVTMADPDTTYVATSVDLAENVTILPGTMLEGMTTVERGAVVGPRSRLIDCAVGPDAVVEETTARGATIGAAAVVGPYAVLVPGDEVAAGARVGPFFNPGADVPPGSERS
jgi:bifunctional UDP-N-acetylglucosamine pyrophosphorylase/glucosamine-1-phosphate N-acetyltransferase